nr:hypothetical protein [Methanobacterium formicicum]
MELKSVDAPEMGSIDRALISFPSTSALIAVLDLKTPSYSSFKNSSCFF